MTKRLLIAMAAAIFLFCVPLPSPAAESKTESDLETIFHKSAAPGMIAALVDGDEINYFGFGQAHVNAFGVPHERSLIRINSLSKLFAGQTVAILIAKKGLSLHAPLSRFAPTGTRVPKHRSSGAIKLIHLLTHTSGLPRDLPTSLAQIPKSVRWQWLSRLNVKRGPGRVAEYSNAAYFFLGDALSQFSGSSYPVLAHHNVISVMRLSDTTFSPSPEQCARLMTGGLDDRPCSANLETAATAGLYSTAYDMARWMQTVMQAPVGSPLGQSRGGLVERRKLSRLIKLDMAGHTTAIGYGWLHMALVGHTVLHKTGGGAGFMNYVILSPEKRLGLFITVTRTDIEMLRGLVHSSNAVFLSRLRRS